MTPGPRLSRVTRIAKLEELDGKSHQTDAQMEPQRPRGKWLREDTRRQYLSILL